MTERTPIQKSFERIEGMSCFACAPPERNAAGLNLVFQETDGGARTDFVVPRAFQSYPGFAHGGIVSAVLDETMAYAGVLKLKVLPFTKRLEVSFRAAVSAGVSHIAEATLGETDDSGFEAVATLRTAEGRTLASARARFIVPTLEMALRMMPGSRWEGFESFFKRA